MPLKNIFKRKKGRKENKLTQAGTEQTTEETFETQEKEGEIEKTSSDLEKKLEKDMPTQDLEELEDMITTEAEKTAEDLTSQTEIKPEEEGLEYLEEATEGQLAVDVYQTDKDIIIKSTIAGVRPEDINVSINNDMLTIKGTRYQEGEIKDEDYFLKECYWGSFSRSIILPVDVKQEKIQASIKDGVLTVRLPKLGKARAKVIKVESEDPSLSSK